jgi:hypothetical protein
MNVAHPASALSEDCAGSYGPVAGDRAPDAPLVRMPDRKTVRLFDVMHGTRWTLLLFAEGWNMRSGWGHIWSGCLFKLRTLCE